MIDSGMGLDCEYGDDPSQEGHAQDSSYGFPTPDWQWRIIFLQQVCSSLNDLRKANNWRTVISPDAASQQYHYLLWQSQPTSAIWYLFTGPQRYWSLSGFAHPCLSILNCSTGTHLEQSLHSSYLLVLKYPSRLFILSRHGCSDVLCPS